jgi:chromosomal replication initiator protein
VTSDSGELQRDVTRTDSYTCDERPLDEQPFGDQWARVRARLQTEVSGMDYHTWLRQMTFAGIEGDEVMLQMPTRFLRDEVRVRFGDMLSKLWQHENRGIRRVDIRVTANGAALAALPIAGNARNGLNGNHGRSDAGHRIAPAHHVPGHNGYDANLRVGAAMAERDERSEPRLDIAAEPDPRYTFDSFVVGKPNEFAHACARRVAEQPSTAGFNPLFLYGGVGLGKTHLMHAMQWELRHRPPTQKPVAVAYMSAERFMYRFIAAIRSQSTMEFKEQLRSVDVLMVDDLQFLIGKENTQEEFFHTFNALVEAGKQIVVSADKSPSDLSGLELRLQTRLGCGMVADLHATTFELRISILEAKAARAGVPVPHKVMEFLAHKITSNVRELEGALNRLVAHANLFNRAVTLEAAQEVLHDVLKAHERRVTIEEIQRRVAEHYHIRLGDMSSARRARNVARPRQVAMYLAKQLTARSLPEIGRRFGGRDHTTVMHAVSRVTELMLKDVAFAEDVELLKSMLEG